MKTNNLILQFTAKIVFFIILFFAVHIFFAGHYTPGGGFVGGLLASSALLLLVLAFDLKTVQQIAPINFIHVIGVGLVIALLTAAFPMIQNKPFFTHSFDYYNLPLIGKTSLHTAALFDLGVFLVVVGVTMTIIQTIGADE